MLNESLDNQPEFEPKSTRVLVTGASGLIGRQLMPVFRETFDTFELDMAGEESDRSSTASIANSRALNKAITRFSPLDTIVHLAGFADEHASWSQLRGPNVNGIINIYEAARRHHVKRIVLASSTHTIGGYEGYPLTTGLGRPFLPADDYRPGNHYGTTKGLAELLAREYYYKYGIESACIRVGYVTQDNKPEADWEPFWLSYRDAAQVFQRAVEAQHIGFGIYYATSDNENMMFDMTNTIHDLDYHPVDGTKVK